MITSISKMHPYWNVRDLVLTRSGELTAFNLSYYDYVPQSLVDNRIIFSVPFQDFVCEKYISKIIEQTPAGCELAFHADVQCVDGVTRHIPMIDMSTASIAQREKLRPFLGDDLFSGFRWYKSGRSYHGYGTELLVYSEWVHLMGRLLLANQKALAHTVDPRWIGHRLMAGYAALRWTKNTKHYLELPRLIA